MNKKEKILLERFIDETRKAIPKVAGIVLYGSMARDEQDRSSDIDVLVIVDGEDTHQFNPLVADIVTKLAAELRPERDLKPLVTNLHDRDEDFYRNVFNDGIVLYGKFLISPERMRLKPFVLVTYNVSSLKKSLKVKVSRMVHGYSGKRTVGGKKYEYVYKGLKSIYNARVVSPSTLLLPVDSAEKFIGDLKKLGVKTQSYRVYMQ